MFPFERISGLRVIELLLAGDPVNQIEVAPIMIGVARHAILACRAFGKQARVIPLVRCQPRGNLLVAFQAFELCAAE